MKRNSVLDGIFQFLPKSTQAAIVELEARGLDWCAHFGYENAEQIKREMDDAFKTGTLYEYMRSRFGL